MRVTRDCTLATKKFFLDETLCPDPSDSHISGPFPPNRSKHQKLPSCQNQRLLLLSESAVPAVIREMYPKALCDGLPVILECLVMVVLKLSHVYFVRPAHVSLAAFDPTASLSWGRHSHRQFRLV